MEARDLEGMNVKTARKSKAELEIERRRKLWVKQLKREGKTLVQICKKAGVSNWSARKILGQNPDKRRKLRPHTYRVSDSAHQKIQREAQEQGVSPTDLLERLVEQLDSVREKLS